MKITSGSSVNAAGAPQGGRAASASGFALPSGEAAAGPAGLSQAMGLAGVGSIDALIALQAVDDPLSRRRRAVGRAGRILDALDGIKLALLDGEAPPEQLSQLAAAVREERLGAEGDEGLQALLDQIETRAVVELAKREAA